MPLFSRNLDDWAVALVLYNFITYLIEVNLPFLANSPLEYDGKDSLYDFSYILFPIYVIALIITSHDLCVDLVLDHYNRKIYYLVFDPEKRKILIRRWLWANALFLCSYLRLNIQHTVQAIPT